MRDNDRVGVERAPRRRCCGSAVRAMSGNRRPLEHVPGGPGAVMLHFPREKRGWPMRRLL